jgi:hypothetical protein
MRCCLEPVFANKTILKGSIYSLVAGLITGTNSASNSKITVAVQQTKPKQQRIGVYSKDIIINPSIVRNGFKNGIKPSRMSMPEQTYRSGLGFAVANELTNRLKAKYHSFEHLDNKGLGFYLPESDQLQLL